MGYWVWRGIGCVGDLGCVEGIVGVGVDGLGIVLYFFGGGFLVFRMCVGVLC